MDPSPIGWPEAEPARFVRECAAMAQVAPGMEWSYGHLAWLGVIPPWPFERPRPSGLDDFLRGRTLFVEVRCSQAHPAAPPRIIPASPEVPPARRTLHDWHVNGDGSLCLIRDASDWNMHALAAELVIKTSGWFLEYCLMEDALVTSMSENGIAFDASLDHFFGAGGRCD